jgi:hypothetical protein
MPQGAEAMWDFVVGLDGDSRASLLAHCVSLSLNAVHGFERRPLALAHAETLATALDLDMTAYWKPTAVALSRPRHQGPCPGRRHARGVARGGGAHRGLEEA